MNDTKLYFFTRIGAKSRFAPQIIHHFPENYSTYIEPFAGSGKIFLTLQKQKDVQYVLNDLDKDIYCLWKDMSRTSADSKEELENMNWKGSKKLFNDLKTVTSTDPLIRLYKNLYINFYSYSGDKNSGYCKKNRVCGKGFFRTFDALRVHLKRVRIFNKDYKDILKRYDHKNSFFYIDPPYLEKGHLYDNLSIDPSELELVLSTLKGKFLLSYNDDERVRYIFQDYCIIELEKVIYTSGRKKRLQKELLIKNY